MISERENWLRVVEFRHPEWIPVSADFTGLTWQRYREQLEEVVLRHPVLFPGFQKGSVDFDAITGPAYTAGEYYTDNWGCVWYNIQDGLEGQVKQYPLADWDALDTYKPPDPLTLAERGPRDWAQIAKDTKATRERGEFTGGDGERLFDRLYFLRGWENLMLDFATDDAHLPKLIEMLTEHELTLVNKWLEIGVDVIYFHTDIGSQKALMISPEKFKRYIKPMFSAIFQTCRKAGTHVYLSSDGHVLEIVDDLIECGVSVHDPQLRANTLEGIKGAYKGKLCANVDLDRQMFSTCTPKDIWRQVRDVVHSMASPEGGLMIAGSVWGANISLENIEALCAALEKVRLGEEVTPP